MTDASAVVNSVYGPELKNFEKNFGFCRNKRIVLYGIGRYTATLLVGIHGFTIIGLMDRDPANVGKRYFGMPVLDAHEVQRNADVIIINTAATYWDLIYQRIKHIGLPVYFRNGVLAEEAGHVFDECACCKLSEEMVEKAIQSHKVITLDFYDTLFSRRLCDPDDVFRLLDREMRNRFDSSCDFAQTRKAALNGLSPHYDFEEVYAAMGKSWRWNAEWLEWAKNRELEIERSILVPRGKVVGWLRRALELGREVYILTDMYLPPEFFIRVLKENGVSVPKDHLWVSGNRKESKGDGSMWRSFASAATSPATILHIGDNEIADVEMPARNGIEALHIMNKMALLRASTLQGLASRICTLYDASVMGCVLSRLFENPLILNTLKGRIPISTNHDMGYFVFGPVLLTFFLWLMRKGREDRRRRLIFMSRDGWFLHKEYEHLCALLGIKSNCQYILISRQLAMAAAIETEAEMNEYIEMPWSGSHAEMLEDRFGIKDCSDENMVRKLQWEYVARLKHNYKRYLSQFGLTSDDAIVDLGFYGNNQRYLNMLLDLKMTGYYVNANLSPDNPNARAQKMSACFQNESDLPGLKSKILEKQIYLESFLTAPYGMVVAIDEAGEPVCRKGGGNQKNFSRKLEIDAGVKQFMTDWARNFGSVELHENPEFVDSMYGAWFTPGAVEFGEGVKAGFYNDNGMMHRFETQAFY